MPLRPNDCTPAGSCEGVSIPFHPKHEMIVVLIILGVWFLIAMLMVFAIVAAARRPACFDPDAPVRSITQESPVPNSQHAEIPDNQQSNLGEEGELPAT